MGLSTTGVLRHASDREIKLTIHPRCVEGQVQGGTSQDVGWDLYEDYCMNVGDWMLDTSFLDYRMPSYTDLPMTPGEVLKVLEENRRGKTRP